MKTQYSQNSGFVLSIMVLIPSTAQETRIFGIMNFGPENWRIFMNQDTLVGVKKEALRSIGRQISSNKL